MVRMRTGIMVCLTPIALLSCLLEARDARQPSVLSEAGSDASSNGNREVEAEGETPSAIVQARGENVDRLRSERARRLERRRRRSGRYVFH